MDFSIKKEFEKVKNSFKKFKKDIINIKKEIIELKKIKDINTKLSNKEMLEISKLKDEIKFLKKVIYSMQTKEEIILPKEKEEIIGNKITLKSHYSSCPFSKKISPENMIIFSSIEESRKNGYSPCTCILNKK